MSSTTAQATSEQSIPRQFRAIILDYGRVLAYSPSFAAIERFCGVFGWNEQQFWNAFATYRDAYDEGVCSSQEFWQNMGRGTGAQLTDEIITNLRAWDVEMWTCLDQSMLNWVKSLQEAGYKIALLSNAPLDFAVYARKHLAWLKSFDATIFSAEIGLVKPGAAIFQLCLKQLGVEPQQALFIDDLAVNVEGARAAGLTAIKFSSPSQLAADLSQMGFDPLPEGSQAF